MDFETARQFLLNQTLTPVAGQTAFLDCLRQGLAPVPGQVTSLLLALRVVAQTLQGEPMIDRALGYALFLLSYESRQYYWAGQQKGIEWPPLLDEDLTRIAIAVRNIWSGESADT